MAGVSKHIIEKFHLEFNTSEEANGKQLERQSLEIFREKLLPQMEKVFDRIGGERNIRLDQLSIEINTTDPVKSGEHFIHSFLEQLSDKLEKVQKSAQDSTGKNTGLLEYFLSNGHFPWWAQGASVAELENEILKEKDFPFSIASALGNDPERLKRLAYQFSDAFLQKLLAGLADKKEDLAGFLKNLQSILSKYRFTTGLRNQLWLLALEALIFQNRSIYETKIYVFNSSTAGYPSETILKELKKSDQVILKKSLTTIQKTPEKPKDTIKSATEEKPDQKTWYVNNAGLVLLHPFFLLLFAELNLTEKKDFKDFYSKNQAALLLHFLATGNTQTAENELILNKILCGIPLRTPVEKELVLDDKITAEANQLLNAAIKHWSALKNTSPDGLRTTFLQREGKLTQTENGNWNLFIQHTTIDILISKLPWSISVIKLPWMDQMLQVEWA